MGSMVFSVTRRATDQDYEKLEKRATAFVKRHGIEQYEGQSAVNAVEWQIAEMLRQDCGGYLEDEFTVMDGKYLQRLWLRIANRAIGDDTIAHDAVGHFIEQ